MHKEQLHADTIFVIREFLTPEECGAFIALSEREGYQEAPVGAGRFAVVATEIRDNARLLWEDAELADSLWQRARPFLPAEFFHWRPVGFNELFRFYRYDPGQKFVAHMDGCYSRPGGEQSQMTFLIYLNQPEEGGETGFPRLSGRQGLAVRPETGTALVFAHKMLHEGRPVLRGRKYVLRTDVMCRRAGGGGEE